jgi:hypothetical protein
MQLQRIAKSCANENALPLRIPAGKAGSAEALILLQAAGEFRWNDRHFFGFDRTWPEWIGPERIGRGLGSPSMGSERGDRD